MERTLKFGAFAIFFIVFGILFANDSPLLDGANLSPIGRQILIGIITFAGGWLLTDVTRDEGRGWLSGLCLWVGRFAMLVGGVVALYTIAIYFNLLTSFNLGMVVVGIGAAFAFLVLTKHFSPRRYGYKSDFK